MRATNEQLLERIKKFLELPGVCAEQKRIAILENCKKLSLEQLCDVAATLRIRARKLAAIANSQEKMQEIKDVKNSIDALFNKYGIQS